MTILEHTLNLKTLKPKLHWRLRKRYFCCGQYLYLVLASHIRFISGDQGEAPRLKVAFLGQREQVP